jgi:hypothetical protein
MGILLTNFHRKYKNILTSWSCHAWQKFSFKINTKKIIDLRQFSIKELNGFRTSSSLKRTELLTSSQKKNQFIELGTVTGLIDIKSIHNKDYLPKLQRIHFVFYKQFPHLRHQSIYVGREKLNKDHTKSFCYFFFLSFCVNILGYFNVI